MTSKRAVALPAFVDVRAKGKRHPNVSGIRRHELVVTSGSIVACDPSAGKASRPLASGVKPGKYTVLLYVPRLGGVGFAELRFSEEAVVRWEKASSYDSMVGFGCFADVEAGLLEHYRRVEDDEGDSYVDDVLNPALKKEGGQYRPSSRTKANVVFFNCAYSDVRCRNFRGFDRRGRLVCIVTDMGFFDLAQKSAEENEREAPQKFAGALDHIRKTLGRALVSLGFVEGAVQYISKQIGFEMRLPFEKGRTVIRIEATYLAQEVRMPNIWIGVKSRHRYFDDLSNIAKDAGVKKVPATDDLEQFADVAKMLTKHFAAIEPKLEALLEKSRLASKEGAADFDAWLKEASARQLKELRG